MSSPAASEPASPADAAIAARPAVAGAAQPSAAGATSCANCGALLTGSYCSECGQRHQDQPVHHFRHFISEAVEDLTHADSRLWQTLIALLFRPGFLTREFLDGRRVRYLPPLRLYLVVSVIFFIIVGLESRTASSYVVLSYNGKSFSYKVVPLPAANATGPGSVARMPARAASGAGDGIAAIPPTPAARQRLCEQMGSYIEQHSGWLAHLGPRMAQSCLTSLAQGGVERFNQIVERNLERAMFLFLPLLALVMKPLYRKPPRHYVEHLLFFLHSHAFLFAMLGLSSLLEMITSSRLVLDPIHTAIAIYVPIYFYRAMRRVYGQGGWRTVSKLAALGVAYLVLGVVMIAATASYSFLML